MSEMQDNKRDKRVTREVHKLFWRANFRNKKNLYLSYVCRIPGFFIVNTLLPLLSAFAIQAILRKDMGEVEQYVGYILGAIVIYAGLTFIGETTVSKNAIVGSEYIQNEVFKNYLYKDYDFYSNTYFGALGAKAQNIRDAFNEYGMLVTLQIPRQITIIATSLAIIAWQSWLLAFITFVAITIVLGFTLAAAAYRVRYRRDVSVTGSNVAAKLGDALTHASTVKSFASEDAEVLGLQPVLKSWSRAQYKAWVTIVPMDIGRMGLAAGAIATLLLVSAHLYAQGSITIPIVILVQLYAVRLVATTIDISQIIKSYEHAMSLAYDPVRTMLIEPQVIDPLIPKQLPQAASHTLALNAVSYRYEEAGKKQYAVRDMTLTVQPGEKIGLVGYSGSGKTTLTKLLLRFMDVTDGSIRLDDIDLRDLRQADIRRVISYVPQEPLLFHRTIAENITYAMPDAPDEDMKRAAKLAYVHEFVKDLPKGYETYVGERGVKLSGGQRQRVAIARALLKDSPILVLDEATSALDSQSEKYIQEALWQLMKDRTAIVIAHRLSTVQRMDRIVVMDKGRIVQVGTHKELLAAKQGIYARLWAHQSGGYLGAEK